MKCLSLACLILVAATSLTADDTVVTKAFIDESRSRLG